MTIVWSPRAIRHLSHLRRYIAQHNPQAADRIAVELLDAVERRRSCPISADPVESPAPANLSSLARGT